MSGQIETNPRAVYRRMKEGTGGVLLHLDSGEYRRVNETGAMIWELLEAAPTRVELLTRLRDRIDDPPETLEAEVVAFLQALHQRGLVHLPGTASPGAPTDLPDDSGE